MKKYFFLLLLFIFYLTLYFSQNNNTKQVILYKTFTDDSIVNIELNFDNGINSNDLDAIFNKYNKEYYVKEINLNGECIELSCDNFSLCISDIFRLKDEEFYNKYVTTGFRIKDIKFIAYKDEIFSFLENESLSYLIN